MAIYPVSCAYCAVGKGCLGDFEKGKIYIEKGLKVAETVQDQFTLALTEFMCGYVYLSRGEGKPAFDLFQTAVKRADELKWMVMSMYQEGFFTRVKREVCCGDNLRGEEVKKAVLEKPTGTKTARPTN